MPYNQFGGRGGKLSMSVVKSDIEMKILRANEIPGPGAYEVVNATETRLKGGRISSGSPKSDIEWTLLRKSKIPAPGDYGVHVDKLSGGRMSSARIRSDLDWKIHFAQQIPGPGAYEVDPYKIVGGKLSVAKVPSDVELMMMRASKQPGPGAYDIDQCPILRPIGSPLGGRISSALVKSDIEWSMLRAMKQPGPLDYYPDENYRIVGGRISRGKVKSDVELAMDRAGRIPGPGEYKPELFSIARRFGSETYTPSSPSRKVERHVQTIPPEARRKPRASTPNQSPAKGYGKEYDTPNRPHSSHGTVGREQSPELPHLRTRNISPAHWVLTQSAASAYGVRKEKDKPRKRKNFNNLRVEVENFDVIFPPSFDTSRSPGAPLSQASTFRASSSHNPGSASPRGSRLKGGQKNSDASGRDRTPNQSRASPEQGKLNSGGPNQMDRSNLSDSARQLYDMAMKSPEFREMMKMYTGVDDPSEIIRAHLLSKSQ